jgi:protein-L-isoaspartate(D-aspartate) O-methyltransferase
MNQDELQAAKQLMLSRQLERRGVRDARVLGAMAEVPRERFLPPDLLAEAYADQALPIDCGQTISQPYIVGLMTEALDLSGNETVLEIGTGSGYQTAILAALARRVVSIERHEFLSRQAGKALAELGYENVALHVGDGSLGFPSEAPYDRIIVTAAASCPPLPLVEQLREGGILVIPLGDRESQVLQAIQATPQGLKTKNLSACRFVPLIGERAWPDTSPGPR